MTDAQQRVQVSGFTVNAGDSFYIVVQTAGAQSLMFWADAVQMEIGVTTASPYIDGDQPGCSWVGTPELSASVQPFQHTASASGDMLMSGNARPVQVGEHFFTAASGMMTMTGDAAPLTGYPVAAFDDFAIFELTDPDPAMTYADQNNAGSNSGHTAYAQNYGLFYPPQDYLVSGGKYAWRRAAYMAMGVKFTAIASHQEQNIALAQVALSPVTGSAPVPLAYTPPRQIQTIIKPTRLNFCTNPSFEVSTAGWSGTGTGTVAQDTSTTAPPDTWLTLAQSGALGTLFNSVAVSSDGSTGVGNFDGLGNSYSAQALADAGVSPGTIVTSGGIEYTIPNAGAGQADNIQATGQNVPLPAPAGASVVGFLGAAANGGTSGISGTVTVTYTDGTIEPAVLGFTDWALGVPPGGGGPVSGFLFGNQVVAALPYRNNLGGTTSTVTTYLFSQTIPADPAKTIASITLPNAPGLHIFAISLAEPTGFANGDTSGKVTVNAASDGAEISLADLIVGDTYVTSLYVQGGPGLADIIAQCSGGSATVSGITGGIPYGGVPGVGYGQGPYGGVVPGTPYGGTDGSAYGTGDFGGNTGDLPEGVWLRASFTFVAQASTETLFVFAAAGTDVTYPTQFWIDNVLVEAGTEVLPYFDGSFGSANYLDYQWEGTAGLSRSYFYQQLAVKQHTISGILDKHTPIGITHAQPQYLVPYSQ
jgi:hypothetical protein